ncbi:MAG: Muramoyltetrapeptide carboxypeptidase, partial [Alphaproteobacteria bacterium]|nr:Muramoyltetrapeptide carboxypeptidase [Alphaproteobacteria bacterium]
MGIIKPKKLKPGDTIGIFGSSSRVDAGEINASAEQLRRTGFNVVIHPQTYIDDKGSAGTTLEKVAALHDLFADKSIDAVISGRGGARALHMLDKIDYDLIQANPKILMGFSDVTTLLSAINARTGLVTFHTITAGGFHFKRPQISVIKTLELMQGNWEAPQWPDDYPTEIIKSGETQGILFGGNLHLLMALLASGNEYVP